MSIIEKAAARLDSAKNQAATQPPVVTAPEAQPETISAQPPVIAAPLPPPETAAINPHIVSDESRLSGRKIELDLSRLQELGMVTPGGGRSSVAEEFRAIKRTLIDHALCKTADTVRRSNLIMVTSSLPGEGKTYCAINLAMSIALELDHTVLLVDADVARPSLLRCLGLNAKRGLMDVLLEDKLDFADVMLKTNVDTLTILPAGTGHRHATELLASQAMSALLDEFSSRYADRIVIFDSPPMLLTSEARVLASQMGQIVMVVEAESTTQNAVKRSLQQLETCPNVSLIYNKSRAFLGAEKYGYSYN